ncbi:MAG TPA: hypothetical protein VF590_20155 [Isosphaeraceae bacterium]
MQGHQRRFVSLGARGIATALLVLVTASDRAGAQVPAAPTVRPDEGAFEVQQVDGLTLRDPKRAKDLPLVICYPKGEGPFPVIVFSHGAGGSGPMVIALPRFWAAHGYVGIAPTHADSLALRTERAAGVPWREFLGSTLRNSRSGPDRARDVSFILDELGALEAKVPALKGKIDRRRIGVGGHSLGAYTAQLIGGVTVDLPGGPKGQSFADDRVRAILLLSGQGRGQQGLTEHSWDALTQPMMSLTGTLDRGAGGQGFAWKGEPFAFSPPGDKYHLIIEGAHHGSFTGRFAGESPPARSGGFLGGGLPGRPGARFGLGGDQKAIFGEVKTATLAFWDAYLKEDPVAKAYLQSDALPRASQGAVKLSRK